MDILLVNSPLFANGCPGGTYADPPPLGLGYIGSMLRRQGFSVTLLDAVAEGMSVEAVCNTIAAARPACLGINVFSTNLHLAEQVVTNSQVPQVFVGGPAAKALIPTVLNWDCSSSITMFVGEAEHAVPAILDGRVVGEAWSGMSNRRLLAIDTASPWFPTSIDLLLDRTLFRHEPVFEEYWKVWEAHIITSRGCGHDCAFCSAARSVNSGQRIRHRSEGHLAMELDEILRNHPHVECIRVLDDLFLRNTKTIERAQRLFPARHLKWRAMAHIAALAHAPKDVFSALRASGCLELFVGVESGSPGRRALIGKPSDPTPTSRVVKELLNAGICVKAYFVLGFPGETDAEMRDTYRLAAQLAGYAANSPGQFRVSAFKFRPYHGTRLYDELLASGLAPGPILEDRGLANRNDKRSVDFASDNFSAVPTECLNEFMGDLLGLNR